MQPHLENPYGLQRPPFPPTTWAPPPPVPAMPPPQVAPQSMPRRGPPRSRCSSAPPRCSSASPRSLVLQGRQRHRARPACRSASRTRAARRCGPTSARAPAEYALFGYVGLLSLLGSIGLSIHAGVRCCRTSARPRRSGPQRVPRHRRVRIVSFWMRLQFGELGHRLSVGFAGIVCHRRRDRRRRHRSPHRSSSRSLVRIHMRTLLLLSLAACGLKVNVNGQSARSAAASRPVPAAGAHAHGRAAHSPSQPADEPQPAANYSRRRSRCTRR